MRKTPRLKLIKPVLATMQPRLAKSREEKERQRFKDRDDEHVWRKLYKTAKWQRLRQVVLVRDMYLCVLCRRVCNGTYPDPSSAVVDHREAHRGDEEKFWDPTNLQVVCKRCHDGAKQSFERGGHR